jgi:multidrug efflux pump subunit AcrB
MHHLHREIILRTLGRVADPTAFGNLVIATLNGTPNRVRDIGWAGDWTKEQRSVARPRSQPYGDAPVTMSIIRTSMTFVWVGPVRSRSPRRAKNG